MTDRFGTIAGTETWADGDLITGDVTIDGGDVTIPAGATILWNASVTAALKIILINGGALHCEGTSSSRVLIESDEGSPSSTDAYGIQAKEAGLFLDMAFTTIRHCSYAFDEFHPDLGPFNGLRIEVCDTGILTGSSTASAVVSGTTGNQPTISADSSATRNVIRTTRRPITGVAGFVIEHMTIEAPSTDPRFGISIGANPDVGASTFTAMLAAQITARYSYTLNDVILKGGTISLWEAPLAGAGVSFTDVELDVDGTSKSFGGEPYEAWLFVHFRANNLGGNVSAPLDLIRLEIHDFDTTPSNAYSGNGARFISGEFCRYITAVETPTIEIANEAFVYDPQLISQAGSGAGGAQITIPLTDGLFDAPTKYEVSPYIRRGTLWGRRSSIWQVDRTLWGDDGQAFTAMGDISAGVSNFHLYTNGCLWLGRPEDGENYFRFTAGSCRHFRFNGNSILLDLLDSYVSVATILNVNAGSGSTFTDHHFRNNVVIFTVPAGYPGPAKGITLDSPTIPAHRGFDCTGTTIILEGDVDVFVASRLKGSTCRIFSSAQVGRGILTPKELSIDHWIFRQLEIGIDVDATLTVTPASLFCNLFDSNDIGYRHGAASNQPTFTDNNFEGNLTWAVQNLGTGLSPLIATSTWWGDATGPSGVGPGIGDPVSTFVTFDPFLFAPCENIAIIIGGLDISDKIRPLNYSFEANSLTSLTVEVEDYADAFDFDDFEGQFLELRIAGETLIRAYVDKPKLKTESTLNVWSLKGKDALSRTKYVTIPVIDRYNYSGKPFSQIFKEIVSLANGRFGLGIYWTSTSIPLSTTTVDFDARGMTVMRAMNELSRRSADEDLQWWLAGNLQVFFRGPISGAKTITRARPGSWHERDSESLFNRIIFSSGAPTVIKEDPTSISTFGQRELPQSDERVTIPATADAFAEGILTRNKDVQVKAEIRNKLDFDAWGLRDLVACTIPRLKMTGTFEIVRISHSYRILYQRGTLVIARGDTVLMFGRLPVKLSDILSSDPV